MLCIALCLLSFPVGVEVVVALVLALVGVGAGCDVDVDAVVVAVLDIIAVIGDVGSVVLLSLLLRFVIAVAVVAVAVVAVVADMLLTFSSLISVWNRSNHGYPYDKPSVAQREAASANRILFILHVATWSGELNCEGLTNSGETCLT